MALVKDFTDAAAQLPLAAAYHRVIGVSFHLEATPAVAIVVGVYTSQAARAGGATPLYRLTKTLDGPGVAAFLASAVWKAVMNRVYTVLKADAQWSGAADAADPAE